MPINSPLDISSCKVWLDMSDLTSLSGLSGGTLETGNYRPINNNDLVGFISDKSGNNNNFSNLFGQTTASRPRLINVAQNNRSVLRFNGVNYLTGIFTLPISAQTTFAVVSRLLAPNLGVGRVYTQTDAAADTVSTNHYIPIVIDGNSNFSSYISGAYRFSMSPPLLSSFDIYTSSLSTNAISGFVFNYLDGLSASNIVPLRRTTSLYNVLCSRIGGGISSNNPNDLPTTFTFLTGDIGEIIVYDRFLTREERTSVEWYLANKWNIPITFYATKNGNWSDESTWSISGIPTPGSFVHSNGYQINIDQNVSVGGLLGIHTSPQNTISTGGTFNLNSPYNITASTSGIIAGTAFGLFINSPISSSNIVISGNVTGGSGSFSHGIAVSSIGGLITLYGNLTGGTGATACGLFLSGNLDYQTDSLSTDNPLRLNVFGNILGRTGPGLFNFSANTVGITGDIIAGGSSAGGEGIRNITGNINARANVAGGTNAAGFGIFNGAIGFNATTLRSQGTVTIYGNLSASNAAAALTYSEFASNYIYGNVHAASGATCIEYNNTNRLHRGEFILSGSVYNALSGMQALFVPFVRVVPSSNNLTINDNRYLVVNQLSSSESFINGHWSQPFAPVTVTPNSWYTPLKASTNSATTIQASPGSTGVFALRRTFTPPNVAHTMHTFSVYAAKNNNINSTGYLELYAITPAFNYGAIFDLNTGNTLTLSPCALSSSNSFFDINTNFRRYGLTFFTPNNTPTHVEIRITTSTSLSQQINNATGNEGFYIWGAQLEQNPPFFKGYVSTPNTYPAAPSRSQIYSPGLFVGEGEDLNIMFNSNAFSVSKLPSISDVVAGVQYGGFDSVGLVSTLTGNMIVPSRNSVKYGTLVGMTSGDSILSVEDSVFLWSRNINDFNSANSTGVRLKDIANIEDVGRSLSAMHI